MPKKRSCVLLADRHHGLTEGVRGLLETAFGTVVMVADEASLIDGAGRLQPDVVVVDLSLAQVAGLGWLRTLRQRCPDLKVIVLSVHDEQSVRKAAMEAGADAFVLKRAMFHLLMIGIRMINAFKRASRLIPCCAVSVVLLAACASSNSGGGSVVSDPSRMTRSGFLSDYAQLAPVAGTEGIQCWRDAAVDLKKFNKVLIARMVVTLKDGESKGIDPTDLKTLTDYFHGSLVKAIQPQMPVVDQLGPDVLVIRIALTDLVPTNVALSVTGTAIPFGYVADAGAGVATGRPAGATPYMGQTGIEMQFRDGGTNAIVAECRDSEVGRKYAVDMNAGASGAAETWANGYMNSFQSWSYAKDAFDKWSALTAKRLGELRGVKVAAK